MHITCTWHVVMEDTVDTSRPIKCKHYRSDGLPHGPPQGAGLAAGVHWTYQCRNRNSS